MPRYLVERTFPEGFRIPPGPEGRNQILSIIDCNSDRNVTWLHSYIAADRTAMYCVYEAPSPEAVRLTARSNGLPVNRITEISVLDPFGYSTSRGQAFG